MSLISLRNVSRVFGTGHAAVRALDDLSFEVQSGEFIAVMGPSGCGKSTLLNLLAGLDRASSGTVRIEDKNPAEMNETELALWRRRRIGFVFQTLNLIATLSAFENIAVPLMLAGMPTAERQERITGLLERAGLGTRADSFPLMLSGGEQQRIAALRAVVHRPALILLDEPTSNLDTPNGSLLLDLLSALRRDEGSTLLLATHDERIAARCDRVLRLLDGRLVNG